MVDDNINIAQGCCGDLEVDHPDDNVTYSWYDTNMESVGTGTTVSVCPSSTTHYILQAAQNGCIVSHTCAVNVSTINCSTPRLAQNSNSVTKSNTNGTLSVAPNPTNDFAIIKFILSEGERGELKITNSLGEIMKRFTVNASDNKYSLDCSNYGIGVYYITLQTDKKQLQKTKLVIIK